MTRYGAVEERQLAKGKEVYSMVEEEVLASVQKVDVFLRSILKLINV